MSAITTMSNAQSLNLSIRVDLPSTLPLRRLRAIAMQSRRDAVTDYWKRPALWDAIFVANIEYFGKRLLPGIQALLALEKSMAT